MLISLKIRLEGKDLMAHSKHIQGILFLGLQHHPPQGIKDHPRVAYEEI